jgi:hypothetical protein
LIRKQKMHEANQLDDFSRDAGMVKNVDERIARIKQQREALAQRLNALEQKSKSEARKRDTRRKIIVGGAVIAQMEKMPDFANLVRVLLNASVGRQNDREAIADLLAAAAPGVASPAAPERASVSPAPAPRANASGMDAGKPDVSGVAPLGAKSDARATSPQSQPPRPPAPPFIARLNPQTPPADPLASDIDNLSRLLGRKSE